MTDVVKVINGSELYESDELAWIDLQIAALRDGDLDRVDRGNLIEFLTDTAARDRRELESRLVVVCSHIIKWHLQHEKATRSWRLTILEQQQAIRRLLNTSPSLAKRADGILRDVYPDAVKAASVETGIDLKDIPTRLEFTISDLLNNIDVTRNIDRLE